MTTNSLLDLLTPTIPTAQHPMWWWQGATGNWYIHSIFAFATSVPFDSANYIFVRREYDGRRSALYIGQSNKFFQRLPKHEKLEAARQLGVNELHVHLLAKSDPERFSIETDLRNGHNTPLNEQGTGCTGLSGLFGIAPSPLAPTGLGALSDLSWQFGLNPYRPA
jgi:hypothetical protein